jgi:hypothetical protein
MTDETALVRDRAPTPDQAAKAAASQALHARPGAFVIPNPWDAGTAHILAGFGFEAPGLSGDRVNPSGVLPHDGMLPRVLVSPSTQALLSAPFSSGINPLGAGIGPSRTSRAIVSRRTFMNR